MIFLSKRSLFPNHVTYVAGPHSLVSVVLAAIARVRWTEKLLSNCYQSYLTVFCSQEAEKLVDTQLAMVHSSQREQKPSSSLRLFLCWFVYCDSYYGRLGARAALWTNQMGYIIVIAWLPGIYGNVNHPCPRTSPSNLGQFTAINPSPHAITIIKIYIFCQIIWFYSSWTSHAQPSLARPNELVQ